MRLVLINLTTKTNLVFDGFTLIQLLIQLHLKAYDYIVISFTLLFSNLMASNQGRSISLNYNKMLNKKKHQKTKSLRKLSIKRNKQ